MTPQLPTSPVPLILNLQYYCQFPNGSFGGAVYPSAPFNKGDFVRNYTLGGRTGPQNFSSVTVSCAQAWSCS